jgi:hypothetical protein
MRCTGDQGCDIYVARAYTEVRPGLERSMERSSMVTLGLSAARIAQFNGSPGVARRMTPRSPKPHGSSPACHSGRWAPDTPQHPGIRHLDSAAQRPCWSDLCDVHHDVLVKSRKCNRRNYQSRWQWNLECYLQRQGLPLFAGFVRCPNLELRRRGQLNDPAHPNRTNRFQIVAPVVRPKLCYVGRTVVYA